MCSGRPLYLSAGHTSQQQPCHQFLTQVLMMEMCSGPAALVLFSWGMHVTMVDFNVVRRSLQEGIEFVKVYRAHVGAVDGE
jgi:hypothetical protein